MCDPLVENSVWFSKVGVQDFPALRMKLRPLFFLLFSPCALCKTPWNTEEQASLDSAIRKGSCLEHRCWEKLWQGNLCALRRPLPYHLWLQLHLKSAQKLREFADIPAKKNTSAEPERYP